MILKCTMYILLSIWRKEPEHEAPKYEVMHLDYVGREEQGLPYVPLLLCESCAQGFRRGGKHRVRTMTF